MSTNKGKAAIFDITLRPMRFLMYATGALPYDFDIYHTNIFQINNRVQRLAICCWRLLHQLLTALFVGWLSLVRLNRYHEVLYNLSDGFSNSIDMVSYGTSLIIYLIVYWENTWKAFYYQRLFNNFEIIHNKFRVLLKVDLKLNRLRQYAGLLYGTLGLYFFIIFLVIYIRYIKSLNGVRLLISQYPDVVLKLKLIEFGLFAIIVMTLQIQLNAFTMEFLQKELAITFSMRDDPAKCKVMEKFAVLQDIHRLLVITMGYIEDYFLWSLPGLLLKMFFEMVYTSYWIYFSADFRRSGYFRLYGYNAILLQVILLSVICFICSKCEMLDKKFANIFHMTKYERCEPILRSHLNEISLQLLHEPISFSAGGFVYVNYKFFGKFIFSAICYIVILIQFHMSA